MEKTWIIIINNITLLIFIINNITLFYYYLQARHSFTVQAEKIFLHTFAASSNPELLAEEAEGEVVVVEFIGLKEGDNWNLKAEKHGFNSGVNGNGNGNGLNGVGNADDKTVKMRERIRKGIKKNSSAYTKNTTFDSFQSSEESKESREEEIDDIKVIMCSFNFSFPVHLRYHTPYDEFFPQKNTKKPPNLDYKTVIIPYPTVFLGAKKCLKNMEIERIPRLERIYDISFLGQSGNSQTSYSRTNLYTKLNADYHNEELINDQYLDDEIVLKVPVGTYSNNFVLLATVLCYFATSSAIVFSLIF